MSIILIANSKSQEAYNVNGNGSSGLCLRRHPILYLSSGDVILSVDRDDLKYMFCVHKHVLSYHSPVFSDMFDLPQSQKANVNDTFDGLPIVHLHDAFADVEVFLTSLNDVG